MPKNWLLAIDLGSVAMLGVAILFAVIWVIDRARWDAALFAGFIATDTAGTLALSVPIPEALAASLHGAIFPIAALMLVSGVLRRVDDRLPHWAMALFAVTMCLSVWFFAYVEPLVAGRVFSQNLGATVLLAFTAVRLHRRSQPTWSDRSALGATIALAVSTATAVLTVLISPPLPATLDSPGQWNDYLDSSVMLVLFVTTTVVLPLAMITMLAATVHDVVHDLRSQRDHDELTGLLNRGGFNRRATTLISENQRCAVVLCDLDYFKKINDALGHAAGDAVLMSVAQILLGHPRDGLIVGRVGGEEFAVLLPDCDLPSAVSWAERARSTLCAHTLEFDGLQVTTTASFGVTVGDSRSSLVGLIDAADRQLYLAKLQGRNRIMANPR